MVALLVNFFLHGVDHCILLIGAQVGKKDGASNEAQDKLLGVLGLGDAPELDRIFLVEIAENFFRNAHSTSLFAPLLGLLEPGVVEWDLLSLALAVGVGVDVFVGPFG